MRRVYGLVSTALVTALAGGAAFIGVQPAAAEGVDLTCVLALEKSDAGTVNVAFPDESAIYWGVEVPQVPGTRVRISGKFPHSRYASFTAYDAALRPIAALADVQIRPKPGHTNPFKPSAYRGAHKRRYTVFVEHAREPENPRPNTMYVGEGQGGEANPVGYGLLYRIYIPDHGTGETGGVPLPRITLEMTNGDPVPSSVCDEANRPSTSLLSDLIAGEGGVAALDAVQPWGRPDLPFRKFVNLPSAFADFVTGNPYGEEYRDYLDPFAEQGGSGGFLSNLHTSYIAGITNRKYGQVLKVRFKTAQTPKTRRGQKRMPRQTQLRYWSFCQEEFFTQRFIACKADDQVVTSRKGFATFVISPVSERPDHARRRCGINWLPWGPNAEGVLLVRNMLARKDFAQSIQNATYEREKDTMRAFYPKSTYYADAKAFDSARSSIC